MKRLVKAVYPTADELDAVIVERLTTASAMSPGEAKQTILKEIALLRNYAAAKRWLKPLG